MCALIGLLVSYRNAEPALMNCGNPAERYHFVSPFSIRNITETLEHVKVPQTDCAPPTKTAAFEGVSPQADHLNALTIDPNLLQCESVNTSMWRILVRR